ncbi:MAG: hypothetical protein HWN81_06170 [Candidatus Lokiarchaeota archaeon]|nr:hypothetical protein [Candidatus Lokiarchaeota archaeon]
MSVEEVIIDKTIVIKSLKQNHQNTIKIIEEDEHEKRIFTKIKRKYRLMLAFLFFLSIILIFMILPMVIGAITQGLWG